MTNPPITRSSLRNLAKVALTVSAIALLAASCSQPSEQARDTAARASNSSEAVAPEEVLTFVAVPASDAETQKKTLPALMDYLGEQLGRQVQFQLAEDYDAAIAMLASGEAQLGVLGPFAYVKAKEVNAQIEPIAAAIDDETKRPWYTSIIIARADRNIQTFADLKGRRFGFVSPSSTSGFLVPSYALQQQQITPESDFAEVIYTGNHTQSIADLVADKVDAVSVERSALSRAIAEGLLTDTNYVQLWESDPIPESPFVINQKFPLDLIAPLKSALINSQGLTNDSGIESSGYTTVTDSDYELIRDVQKAVGQP